MKAPAFWQKRGAGAWLLSPLGTVYGAGSELRQHLFSSWKAPAPVICIGNLTVGGSGKTPAVAAICDYLRNEKQCAAHILCHGYGGDWSAEGLVRRVNDASDRPTDTGDEAILLSRHGPAWVAPDRVAGAKAALLCGAELLITDDGFQDPALEKDLSFLVIDGNYGFGNGLLLPAGPLREFPRRGVKRADAVILVGEDQKNIRRQLPSDLPVLRTRLVPGEAEASALAGEKIVAFAGIARPERFFATLEKVGAHLQERKIFPDHHFYTRADLLALEQAAKHHKARLVTTEKDAARFSPQWREKIAVLPVTLAWEEKAALDALLAPLLKRGKNHE